jgi:hypothetical protein
MAGTRAGISREDPQMPKRMAGYVLFVNGRHDKESRIKDQETETNREPREEEN